MGMLTSDELHQRRDGLGMTQAALAKCLGVHVRTISKWERGINTVPPWVDLAIRGIESKRRPRQLQEGSE